MYIRRLGQLVSRLLKVRLYPDVLREELLKGLAELAPTAGPCSVLQLDRFFSEGGDCIGITHANPPEDDELLKLWEQHIARGDSVIEQRIFDQGVDQQIGLARLSDLFTVSEWEASPLFPMAERAGVAHMAHLWIRCSPQELWIVCLRRLESEEDFTAEEMQLLRDFAELFLALHDNWYLGFLAQLTPTQREVVQLSAAGMSAREGGRRLDMSHRTWESHMDNARKRLAVQGKKGALLAKILHFWHPEVDEKHR